MHHPAKKQKPIQISEWAFLFLNLFYLFQQLQTQIQTLYLMR
jgi:hypothetical protein